MEKIAKKRAKKGLATSGIDDRPNPYPDLQFLWRAFCELSTSRSSGFGGEESIKFSEIHAWLELSSVHRRRWPEFVETILSLDRAYMKEAAKSQPKAK